MTTLVFRMTMEEQARVVFLTFVSLASGPFFLVGWAITAGRFRSRVGDATQFTRTRLCAI